MTSFSQSLKSEIYKTEIEAAFILVGDLKFPLRLLIISFLSFITRLL